VENIRRSRDTPFAVKRYHELPLGTRINCTPDIKRVHAMKEAPVRIAMVERLGPDIIVYFSDGSSAVFVAKFLFDMQAQEPNVLLQVGEKTHQA
jgi:hypothetical protein